jgi:hypothetical protein
LNIEPDAFVMDLTYPADVERAARASREFVESRAPAGLATLASLVAASPLAQFAVLRELGQVVAPWAETLRAAGLQLHDLGRLGLDPADAGLVGLALGDPRRRPDPSTLGVTARPSGHLDGVVAVAGLLAPVDSLVLAATLPDEAGAIGVFHTAGPFGAGTVALAGAPARRLERGEAAWALALAAKRQERLAQIALALGAADRASHESLALAREATAVRDALALGQGVQFQVADNAIDLQVAETLGLHCATLAEAGTLTDADLASTRFMVVEALGRIAERAAHVAGLFTSPAPPWTTFVLDLARRLGLEGGALELDRREAALGVLQSA